ncbi:MAG: acyl-ACP--UDP-N-acetylglucosamine O-acyltransferase [Acidobacteriota bacterium]
MSVEVAAGATVAEGARIGSDVLIGPGSVVGPDVVIGDRCRIGPLCVLDGRLELGPDCVLSSHSVLGSPPQDLKYDGEPTTTRIGARNQFREFTTVNRGTAGGGAETIIGDDNLFMTGAHVAHDCRVGSGTIFANNATLAGHVDVADCATVGAFSAVHQFCSVGRHAFIGGYTVCTKDVLPFIKTVGSRGDIKALGVNAIGLRRRGLEEESVSALQAVFRRLRRGRFGKDVLAELGTEELVPEVRELVDFVVAARERRGVHA